jgi:hypothetical protein
VSGHVLSRIIVRMKTMAKRNRRLCIELPP